MLAVRTTVDPLSLSGAIRSVVLDIDRDQPVSEISTMADVVEASEGQLRLIMRLLAAFAIVATGLAVLGLYGVISFSVVRRTREIAIRRALGAQDSDVLFLLLKKGLILATAGVLLGVGGSLALTRLLRDLLFQVRPTDPTTFVGVSVVFAAVAVAATLVPARRAAGVDPLVAIRSE
jgi:ABC-type antimicrobial peptide transport system permease subunit